MWSITENLKWHTNYVLLKKMPMLAPRVRRTKQSEKWYEYRGENAYQWVLPLDQAEHEIIYAFWQNQLEQVNADNWGMKLRGWNQPIHIAEYPIGGSFPLHTDYNDRDASKLAFIQLLSSKHSGGELYIGGAQVKLSPGDAVIFPTYIPHQVKPIYSGTRRTLAGWATGPRFV